MLITCQKNDKLLDKSDMKYHSLELDKRANQWKC